MAAAPAHVGDLADGRDRTRWFPALVSNHVVDLVNKYPRERAARGAHRLRPRTARATTTSTTPRSARRTPSSWPTRSSTGSASWAPSTRTSRKLRALAEAGRRPVQPLPDERGRGGAARDLRPRDHPGAARRRAHPGLTRGSDIRADHGIVASISIAPVKALALVSLDDADVRRPACRATAATRSSTGAPAGQREAARAAGPDPPRDRRRPRHARPVLPGRARSIGGPVSSASRWAPCSTATSGRPGSCGARMQRRSARSPASR